MGMGGSLLPSHDARVLAPQTVGKFLFVVMPMPELETYALMANGSVIAMHPNGYSLKEIVSRIAAYRACVETKTKSVAMQRALTQWQYILDCGGLTKSESALTYYLGMTI